jgi:hypothetical protein
MGGGLGAVLPAAGVRFTFATFAFATTARRRAPRVTFRREVADFFMILSL